MTPLLLLVHALAGALVLALRRSRAAVMAVAVVAGTAGLALVVVVERLAPWRTVGASPDALAIAAAGVMLAWLVIAARPGDGAHAAATAIACAALLLAAGNEWVAPAALFWVVSTIGLAVAARHPLTSVALAGSSALLLAVFVMEVSATEAWTVPGPLVGVTEWLLLGAIGLRVGIVPWLGPWPALREGRGIAPVSVAGGFVLVESFVMPVDPWVPVVLLGLGLLLAAWIAASRTTMAAVGAWATTTLLGIALIDPHATVIAAVAACLVAAAVELWPEARGRASMSRGLLVALVPPTPAFVALAVAAVAAFEKARAELNPLAWTIVSAELALTVAAGVAVAATVAGRPRSDDFEPAPVLATWGLIAAALAGGLFATPLFGVRAVSGRVLVLYGVAVAIGALVAKRSATITPVSVGPPGEVASGTTDPPLPKLVTGAASALQVLAWTGALWITITGLEAGFL